jgi:hypothetical protein
MLPKDSDIKILNSKSKKVDAGGRKTLRYKKENTNQYCCSGNPDDPGGRDDTFVSRASAAARITNQSFTKTISYRN